jgi:hypothetical protein
MALQLYRTITEESKWNSNMSHSHVTSMHYVLYKEQKFVIQFN